MSHDILSVISLMAEVASRPPQGEGRRPRKPVITISRDYGSGGDEVAAKLSERLGLNLYDERILKEVSARLEDDPEIVRLLDEGFGRAKDMWLYRWFSGKDVGPDQYRDTLIKVVMSLGRLGGVFVGRGAHVVLAGSCALRVRVSGTPEVCAHRLATAGRGVEADLLAQIREINHNRGKFVWDAFHSRLADATQFDITVNTDRIADLDAVVDMLIPLAKAVHGGTLLRNEFGAG